MEAGPGVVKTAEFGFVADAPGPVGAERHAVVFEGEWHVEAGPGGLDGAEGAELVGFADDLDGVGGDIARVHGDEGAPVFAGDAEGVEAGLLEFEPAVGGEGTVAALGGARSGVVVPVAEDGLLGEFGEEVGADVASGAGDHVLPHQGAFAGGDEVLEDLGHVVAVEFGGVGVR